MLLAVRFDPRFLSIASHLMTLWRTPSRTNLLYYKCESYGMSLARFALTRKDQVVGAQRRVTPGFYLERHGAVGCSHWIRRYPDIQS